MAIIQTLDSARGLGSSISLGESCSTAAVDMQLAVVIGETWLRKRFMKKLTRERVVLVISGQDLPAIRAGRRLVPAALVHPFSLKCVSSLVAVPVHSSPALRA